MELSAAPAAQIRDAEMNIEHLCHKYETLSAQLLREEQARADVERRGAQLASEVATAESAATHRSNKIVAETSASVAALRATASDAERRALLESKKASDEKATEARMEQECAALSEQCRSEAGRCEQALSQLTLQDREAAKERCEHGDVGRRLRQAEADTRVSLEDLRIAQQRALLVRSELHTLEASLESRARAHETSVREADVLLQQLQERRRHFGENELRLESLLASIEMTNSECVAQDRRLSHLREEEGVEQAHVSLLRRDLQTAQQEARTLGHELHAEVEASNSLAQELDLVGRRRAHDAEEASLHRRSLAEAESSLEALRKGTNERRVAREAAAGRFECLTAEEEGHVAAASELRRARNLEDLAFDDVQSELQISFRRRESLSEDLALGARSRDNLLQRLRQLRPEAQEVEERCRDMEEQLAQRARDMEDEIAQQRHYQQELVSVSDLVLRAQREESRMEAELHHATVFQRSGSVGKLGTVTVDGGSIAKGPAATVNGSPRPSGRHRGPTTSAPWASPSPAPQLRTRFGGLAGRS